MFEILFPLPFLTLGFLFTFHREKAVIWFCRLGKTVWRHSTFGLTDMAYFYQEERAKKTFRLLGPIFLCCGLMLCWFSYLSFSGPGTFAAMRESRSFLASKYEDAWTWKASASTAADDGSVDIDYQYGTHIGKLHAVWVKDHYIFAEIPANKKTN
jgi:hypothetical protein